MKESAYRLLLVDDDEEVRSGLADIVDWERCGFCVAAALKDGQEAISYLEQHPVDVVLSDIRMMVVSGLDLAKYVFESRISAKVVLISGYQEFELAKEALRYNVQEYLLKPTDLDEVYRLFDALKVQLDEERSARNRSEQDREMWEQMTRYLKERYLPHLLSDTLADIGEIGRQFEMVGIRIDPYDCACACVEIEWSSGSAAADVSRALLQSLPGQAGDVTLLPFGMADKPLRLLAFVSLTALEALEPVIDDMLRHAAAKLHAFAGLTLGWTIGPTYASLDAFLKERRTRIDLMGEQPSVAQRQWEEDKARWIDCLEAERYEEAEGQLQRLFDKYEEQSIDAVKSLLIQLFGSLDAVYAEENFSALLMQLCRSEQPEKIRSIGQSLLQELSRREAGDGSEKERRVIKQAKQYVKEHSGNDISLQEVADYVFLNPVYLSRLFKRETGQSFTDHVTETRMQLAASLLKKTNMKIYEICDKSGYKDVRHFYKLFKQYAGCSPSEYRERVD